MSRHSTEKQVNYKSLDFLGYPNYLVGDDGSIWSWDKHKADWRRKECGEHGQEGEGRLIVNLNNENGGKTFTVSRLVLLSFIGPCPEGMECCHFPDPNPKNNQLKNLRWGTHNSNEGDKKVHGTSNDGERNGSAKLNERQVRWIRKLYRTGAYSMSQLAKRYNITLGTIHPLIAGKTWKNVEVD